MVKTVEEAIFDTASLFILLANNAIIIEYFRVNV